MPDWKAKLKEAERGSVGGWQRTLVLAMEHGYSPYETVNDQAWANMVIGYRELLREVAEAVAEEMPSVHEEIIRGLHEKGRP